MVAGQAIDIDWARLVSNDAATFQTITWSGTGAVDLYLDDDAVESNGTLGLIAKNATTLTFTSPSPEGSSDDFATAQLGNPWDMDSVADVDATVNVTGLRVGTRTITTTDGVALGAQRVLDGASVAGTMDPILYLLAPWKRGAAKTIDPSRYRIMTMDLGIDGARDINQGSVARVIWRARGDSENVSEDIIVNHRAGMSSLETISLDMKSLPLEAGAGSPSHSGWNGVIEEFRIDPHEFTPATSFWVRRVKLAALENAGTTSMARASTVRDSSTA